MKTNFLVAAVAAVALVGIDAPASAQVSPSAPTGSRLKAKPDGIDPNLVREMQREFGQCVYKSRPEQAQRLLENSDYLNVQPGVYDLSNDALDRAFDMDKCLGKARPSRHRGIGMTYSLSSLRSMLTEAAYLAHHDRPLVIGEDDEIFLTSRPFVNVESVTDAKILAGFADCVVYSAPVESDALARTEPGSDEEGAAIQRLVPYLGPCLEDGNDISLSVETVRAIIADGLWARHAYSRGAQVASN